MPDEPTESAPEVAEAPALPTPAVSQPSEAKQPSAVPDADALVSRVRDTLLPEFERLLDRRDQSVKDKRLAGQERSIAALEGQVSEMKARLAEHGGDVTKTARDIALDDILSRGQEQQPASGRSGEDWETGVQKILSEAEKIAGVKVPLDDPDLQAAAKGSYQSWADAYAAINRVVLRRAKGLPAASMPTEVTGIPVTPPDVDGLTATIQKLIATPGTPTDVILAAKQKLLEAMSK